MSPFCELNTDRNHLVKVLGLNFDPKQELKKRAQEKATAEKLLNNSGDPHLQKIREEEKLRQQNQLN